MNKLNLRNLILVLQKPRRPSCDRSKIKDDQEPFNSIALIPLESFYGSEIKLNGGIGKMHGHRLQLLEKEEN